MRIGLSRAGGRSRIGELAAAGSPVSALVLRPDGECMSSLLLLLAAVCFCPAPAFLSGASFLASGAETGRAGVGRFCRTSRGRYTPHRVVKAMHRGHAPGLQSWPQPNS